MKKTQGKAKKFIKKVISEINYAPFVELKSDNIMQKFEVNYLDKKATVDVQIKNKNLVFYDDKNIKKVFKSKSPLGEAILDCLIANFIGFDHLEDI